MPAAVPGEADDCDRDVAIVGGGPGGSAAAVFTARYGLETEVFDRGSAALRQSAFLANYPGFPAGVDVDTFYELLHAHLAEAGARRTEQLVEAVRPLAPAEETEPPGYVVETDAGETLTARRVVAAAWYDASYLRPVCGDDAYERHEHHGEAHERFDPEYAEADGRTPHEGLYVAAPNGDRNDQAVIAAGQGAHVARSVIEDVRRAVGHPDGVAEHYDWLRPATIFEGEWGERDRWREWYENEAGEHELDEERFRRLRDASVDRAFETALAPEAVQRRTERGIEALVETIGEQRVLDAVDDEAIATYLAGRDGADETDQARQAGDAGEAGQAGDPGEAGQAGDGDDRDASDDAGPAGETPGANGELDE